VIPYPDEHKFFCSMNNLQNPCIERKGLEAVVLSTSRV